MPGGPGRVELRRQVGKGMGTAGRPLHCEPRPSALLIDPEQLERDEDLPRLIAKLAQASASLEESRNGRIDALGDPVAFSHLLDEAQAALVESDERARDEAALLDALLRSAPDIIVYAAA